MGSSTSKARPENGRQSPNTVICSAAPHVTDMPADCRKHAAPQNRPVAGFVSYQRGSDTAQQGDVKDIDASRTQSTMPPAVRGPEYSVGEPLMKKSRVG